MCLLPSNLVLVVIQIEGERRPGLGRRLALAIRFFCMPHLTCVRITPNAHADPQRDEQITGDTGKGTKYVVDWRIVDKWISDLSGGTRHPCANLRLEFPAPQVAILILYTTNAGARWSGLSLGTVGYMRYVENGIFGRVSTKLWLTQATNRIVSMFARERQFNSTCALCCQSMDVCEDICRNPSRLLAGRTTPVKMKS